jgi:hypothetical protein
MRGGVLFPDPYLAALHLPGQRPDSSAVNDSKLTEMIGLQRRTLDVAKRRDIIWDIQRYLAEQVHYLCGPSARVVAAWEPTCATSRPTSATTTGTVSWRRGSTGEPTR